jgi:nucleotide-binding universal stress UspA family protein
MADEFSVPAESPASSDLPVSGPITRMLVGWDGTPPSEAAIDWALARAAATPCVIEICRTVDETYVSADYVVTESTLEWVRDELAERVRRLNREYPALAITARLFQGDPAEELRRESNASTLVVVGTHARKGPAFRFAWSLGARLAATATGPVAIIPVQDPVPAPGAAAKTRGIVVGVDGSPASMLAIDFAAREAIRNGMVLVAVHAWLSPPMWLDAQLDEESMAAIESMHDAVLTDVLLLVAARHPGVVFERSLAMGDPHWVLLNAAENAALLVVGNHGRRGISRLMLGSVSHSVVLNLKVPTVVVREPGR